MEVDSGKTVPIEEDDPKNELDKDFGSRSTISAAKADKDSKK